MDFGVRVRELVSERQHLARELARIDETLNGIRGALSGLTGPNGTAATARPGESSSETPRRRKRGRRGFFATTADELILSVVGNRGATTQEIKERWKGEGRGGTADNALSKMVKEGRLKRSALKEGRGSQYTAA